MRVADVMTQASLSDSPTDTPRDAAALQSQTGGLAIDSDELVRARRIVRIEHGDLD